MAGSTANRHRGICYDYRKPSGCNRRNCKFLHVDANGKDSKETKQRPQKSTNRHKTPATTYSKFENWRRQIPKEDDVLFLPLGSKLPAFFKEALELINDDPAMMQEVVQQLASSNGLQRIAELCKRCSDNGDLQPTTHFFDIITHPHVVGSIVLESSRGDICQALWGFHGNRFIPLFDSMIRQLTSGSNVQPGNVLSALQVFIDVLRLRTNAIINPDVNRLALELVRLSQNVITVESGSSFHHATRLHENINKLLKIGGSDGTMTEHLEQQANLIRELPQFTVPIEYPGTRHDNDKMDISEISIMPTMEEIMSNKSEFLPTINPATWISPENGLEGLIDRQFRLLREDTVGQLRYSVRFQMEKMRDHQHRNTKQLPRTFVYHNADIIDICMDRNSKGLSFWVAFEQPKQFQQSDATSEQRKNWWAQSKRLQSESLVCYLDPSGSGTTLFCCVAASDGLPKRLSSNVGKNEAAKQHFQRDQLHGDKTTAYLQLSLISSDSYNIGRLLGRFPTQRLFARKSSPVLVEFPGILVPAFEPTLKALQLMKKIGTLPFSTLLIPTKREAAVVQMDPPPYSLQRGFTFDLSPITTNSQPLNLVVGAAFDVKDLSTKSTLDEAQAKAVINALRSKLALIQGPPGTGKSYTGVALIKVLLKIKTRANLGPIMIVSYTNHALDQMLEHLIGSGIHQIIRLGSRSKSDLLQELNLNQVVQKNSLATKTEKRQKWECHSQLDEARISIAKLSKQLKQATSWSSISRYLESHNPEQLQQLEGIDNEGFQEVRHKSKKSPLSNWLNGNTSDDGQPKRPIQITRNLPLFQLSHGERRELLLFWISEIKNPLAKEVRAHVADYVEAQERLRDIKHEEQLRCLREADIIGVTSSGLARNLSLLKHVKSKVVVIEEAGELLEAHTLTSFLPHVEHAILIGDDLQLRPQINSYDLSRESSAGARYSLDMSLFERLVRPVEGTRALTLPHTTLTTQRRMHPSISELIRKPLYPDLEDAPNVRDYPEVTGMRRRLFWLDHDYPEGGSSETEIHTTSQWNDYEVDTTVALTSHLVKQGYSTGDKIAVLTPYLRQLQKLRSKLGDLFEIVVSDRDQAELAREGLNEVTPAAEVGESSEKKSILNAIRVATVDNFQGEEADVIVISLVRSNTQRKCGFLRTSNRINVLLSRARHGMYIIGNSATAETVPMWSDTIQVLRDSGNLGTSFELACPRHPETPIFVKGADEFESYSPEGGCQLQCQNRLKCGHVCKRPCHSSLMHSAVYCDMPCQKLLPCQHPCPNLCSDVCLRECKVQMDMGADFVLSCGHHRRFLPCWQSQDTTLYRCTELVSKTFARCKHTIEVGCHVDIDDPKYRCEVPCEMLLECGHTFRSKCFLCPDGDDGTIIVNHGFCTEICGKNFTTCSHSCQRKCHSGSDCGSCTAPCSSQCSHSKCSKPCGQPCPPCAETTCASQCPHTKCLSPCAAPCSHLPCSKRCEELLSCGHQCPSLCGETCPSAVYCQLCAEQGIKDEEVDYILFERYQDTDLNIDPIIIPPCGHFLTVSTMDGLMAMGDYYEMDSGKVKAIKSESLPFSSDELKCCPKCRGPLTTVRRYGRISRRALLDQLTKKMMSWYANKLPPLFKAVQDEQDKIVLVQSIDNTTTKLSDDQKDVSNFDNLIFTGSVEGQINSIKKSDGMRYRKLLRLQRELAQMKNQVRKEEQPFQKVFEMVENLRLRGKPVTKFEFDSTVLQFGLYARTEALLIRCELIIISSLLDSFRRWNIRSSLRDIISSVRPLDVDFTENLKRCEKLIQESKLAVLPRPQTQGHIFTAEYLYLWGSHTSSDEDRTQHFNQARDHIIVAKALADQYPGSTNGLREEIISLEKALNGGIFYQTVTSDEMRAITAAMAQEFRGTGYGLSLDLQGVS
jgi:AAA domain-containing protein